MAPRLWARMRMGMRKCWVVEWHQEAVMELSVDVCVVVRVEEKEKPGLRGWLQKWWGAQGGPATGRG